LYLLLTSAAREALRGVETVVVDEVHAVCGVKRGAHLALSLERLDELLERPAQRIGLSATVRPVEATARYLGGERPVTIVNPPAVKTIDLSVEVTVEDLANLTDVDDYGQPSVWPSITRRLYDLITSHRSTIVFADSRSLTERLCARLNEHVLQPHPPYRAIPAQVMAQSQVAAGSAPVLARAHHGSMSREERLLVESALKSGELRCVVSTSSLELGIDMGEVDLVVQIGAPPSVASGLQRVGRAGHQVGAVSRGVMLSTHRSDLLAAAVTAERMSAARIEELLPPRHPLDVLAQQVTAMVAMDDWTVERLGRVVRRAASFASLPEDGLRSVLDMASGRYPSTGFSGLKPKLVWDRQSGRLSTRPGAQRVAVLSGGTIPDRGLYGVFLAESGPGGNPGSRVGELDEEMVYESRVGDVFLLGATSWRIETITPDRVLVSPAPGQPARMPFWKGEDPGRPAELGRAIGARLRDLKERSAPNPELNDAAATNLLSYVSAQLAHAGTVCDDRTVVVERFRDELGDWRVVVHCVLGAKVNRPWATAIAARLRDRLGVDGHVSAADDGIVLRLPDMPDPPGAELVRFDPEEIAATVTAELVHSPLFAARFRECAARSLVLTRRGFQRRQPLWQQRHRAGQLFDVAREFADFPVTAEAARECLEEYFDMPALEELLRGLASGSTRAEETVVESASPFSQSLLAGYTAGHLYGEDEPLAERRAAALNSGLLDSLLGDGEQTLRPDVVAEAEGWLQWRDGRDLSDAEDVAELLRVLGDVSAEELSARGVAPAAAWELVEAGRAVEVSVAGQPRFVAVEDAARY
ncbi:MAG: DEAD/DEAH box helicase, partial [Stackebrandtia sp.]